MQGFLLVARAVKLTQSRHDLRDVQTGGPDVVQVRLVVCGQSGFAVPDQVGTNDDGRERVVDVVRHATGHLAERLEPFLLHGGLLRLAQLVVGLVQILIHLRLAHRQRHVRGQAVDELAFGGEEAVDLAPHEHQQAKHVAFHEQRHRQSGEETGLRRRLGNGRLQPAVVG